MVGCVRAGVLVGFQPLVQRPGGVGVPAGGAVLGLPFVQVLRGAQKAMQELWLEQPPITLARAWRMKELPFSCGSTG